MVSWDLAERTIDSTSNACRESLQTALEQPNSLLSPVCQAEVARILDDELHPDDGKPRRGVNKNGGQDDSKGSKHDSLKADGTHATTIVLAFVICALVAVVALAGEHQPELGPWNTNRDQTCWSVRSSALRYVSGGRSVGGRPIRSARRLHKKKQDKLRDRGKRRR